MTAQDAREALLHALNNDSPWLENFLARGESLTDSIITRFDLIEAMAVDVVHDVTQAGIGLAKKQFLDYDPSYQTNSSQVLVEPLDLIPELAAVDEKVRLGNVQSDEGGTAVVAMAHKVGDPGNEIVAYRMKGPGIATRRKRGITLIPRDGIYRPVEDEILFYEPQFDAFTCAGFAYFSSVALIQTKLQADSKARELARTTLKGATANVLIDGYDDLERAVMDDPNLRAKMAAVARLIESEPEYANFLTTEKLVEFAKNHANYNILVSNTDGQPSLLFNASPQHRHQIPKLLADDYLHSFLTDRSYEAGSKQRVQT